MQIVDVFTALVTRHPRLEKPFADLCAVYATLLVECPGDERPATAEVEDRMEAAVDGLACAGMGEYLALLSPDAAVVEVQGVRYRRMKNASPGMYFTRRGAVEVERHLYRQVGVRNGPTIVPLELRAGLVLGRWTPRAAVAAAHLLQAEPTRDAVDTCRSLGVMPYSRSSLARGGDAIGERWEKHRDEGEDFLAAQVVIPEEAASLSVSVDRVSLPMVELLLDDAGEVVEDEHGKPRIEVNYRMAFCGVWTLHDAKGDPLLSTRYGRMPHEGHDPIEESLRGDVEAILGKRPNLKLVGLADGAPEMQNILTRIFAAVSRPDAPIGVDFFHLLEKLSAALRAVGKKPKEYLPGYAKKLKTDHHGIERIEMDLLTWALSYEERDAELPEALAAALTYIDNLHERMRYKHLIEAGLPIGSGGVEATCKSLVTTRMKRCGASWKTPGGQVVLSLRSLARSSRWDQAISFLVPTFVAQVEELPEAA